jgi:hypothetical protein
VVQPKSEEEGRELRYKMFGKRPLFSDVYEVDRPQTHTPYTHGWGL